MNTEIQAEHKQKANELTPCTSPMHRQRLKIYFISPEQEQSAIFGLCDDRVTVISVEFGWLTVLISKSDSVRQTLGDPHWCKSFVLRAC